MKIKELQGPINVIENGQQHAGVHPRTAAALRIGFLEKRKRKKTMAERVHFCLFFLENTKTAATVDGVANKAKQLHRFHLFISQIEPIKRLCLKSQK